MSQSPDSATFNATKILNMFRMSQSKQTLLNLEEKGQIPKAQRVQRGKVSGRTWQTNQLPEIGEKFGFLPKLREKHVISVFSLKGGTNKSTFAYHFGRILALHNYKTLIIGMDAQESITQTIRGPAYQYSDEISEDGDDSENQGIFHVLSGEARPEDVIEHTDLKTLDFIPENIELSVLDRWMAKSEYPNNHILKSLVKPLSDVYDMILFDCNPSWDLLVTNALHASDILLSPMGCDINSLKATKIFTDLLREFQDVREWDFSVYKLIPTMLENNKLSQQILAKYRIEYTDICSVQSLRRSVAAQEANVLGKSLMETHPKQGVTHDYMDLTKEIVDAVFLEESEENETTTAHSRISNRTQPEASV